VIRFILVLALAFISSCTTNTYVVSNEEDSVVSDTIDYKAGNTNIVVYEYVCAPDGNPTMVNKGIIDTTPHHLWDRAVAYINAEYIDTMMVSETSLLYNWMDSEFNASCNDIVSVLHELNVSAHSSSYMMDKTGVMRNLKIDLVVRSQCSDIECETLIDNYYN